MKRILAALALVLALGCAAEAAMSPSMRLEQSMHRMQADMSRLKTTGDVDRDFAAMMIVHHAGAIAMARTELKYGRDAELRTMARSIIAAQAREIADLRAWLVAHPTVTRRPGPSSLRRAMQSMHAEMSRHRLTGSVDHDFAALMVIHHRGAIHMSRAELSQGVDPELRAMADHAVMAQGREVARLETWLDRRAAGDD